MLGIIGGTGLTALDNLNISKRLIVRTPYGEPSQPLVFGEINGKEVVFLARHGGGHTIPPHAVNYRANIWALHSVGVCDLLAVATVGGIAATLKPGDIVLPNQILDYTYGRSNTYHDGIELPVRHIDFTQPYSQAMRERCLKAAADIGDGLIDGGVYASVQGPRLETAAEINRYERDGATIVGMTGMPEAVLARELGVSYAAICPVANFAAGRGDSAQSIQFEQVMPLLQQTMDKVRAVIAHYLSEHDGAAS
ncbi:S-methyl-5'-thioinosine phosphorylase [Methylophilus medardicus]|uniref:Probable 6-oxopurine nucleoside phosphorylase n=1 Tax=Methylophilus medardicus TaxID=2588534 RepID=A0A5B8CRL0_9PROT|nr:S-methyl-5'-thioinosine phosphorylase [Methylophilus medardicus]QDC43903.1 S-methyl-5'-thioinosine phosphorylase [Methylophilus medardicus]QDC48910.1 S-methyl-5'-thioinosine phosphorylase [Methylophilus medardicus]QDC52615.1 S-methyl-5'-thioinosine phosphorylase [Methylophilus medardicus]